MSKLRNSLSNSASMKKFYNINDFLHSSKMMRLYFVADKFLSSFKMKFACVNYSCSAMHNASKQLPPRHLQQPTPRI